MKVFDVKICRWGLIVIVALFGCRPRLSQKPSVDVVLVTIDTLRCDHLSCYGYPRPTTPFIDQFSKTATLYPHAYAASSWTVPSMASIFTGLNTRHHGVNHGVINIRDRTIVKQETLKQEFLLLAEVLKNNGYKTFGISTNGHLSRATGFAQGFDRFEMFWFSPAKPIFSVLPNWESELRSAQRYFLWVHVFDPHDPYTAREPWISRYAADKNRDYDVLSKMKMKNLRYFELFEKRDRHWVTVLENLYDSEINYTDEVVRRMMRMIPLDDDTMIIIAVDHGEGFMDHRKIGHGNSLYEELIHVPLIIRYPAGFRNKHIVDFPVCHIDLLPTICDVLGISLPEEIDGRSFLYSTESKGSGGHPIFADIHRVKNKVNGETVITGGWKLISLEKPGEKTFLFNLDQDPGEKMNLIHKYPDIAEPLLTSLKQWKEKYPLVDAPQNDISLTEDEKEKLKALGYLK